MKNKICPMCKVTRDYSEYHKSKSTKDGLASNCKSCRKIITKKSKQKTNSDKRYYEKNKDKIKKKVKKWKEENKEHVVVKRKEYYEKNKKRICEKNREWARDNRVRSNKIKKKYNDNNPHIRQATKANRRYQDRCCTPRWYDKNEMKLLWDEKLELEKRTGISYNLDHILPIMNKNICGLNIPENIQIIPAYENRIKSNSFDWTIDNESWRDRIERKETEKEKNR